MSKRLNMSNDEAVEWLLSLKNLDICGENRKTAIDKAIQALEQRWIPVSDKLPGDGTVVFYTDNKGETGMICYWEDLPQEFENIIAWMPLPAPYKAESEDKE